MNRLATALATFAAGSLLACAPAELSTEGLDEKPAADGITPKIRNGTRTPTAVALTEGQQLAIGWLYNQPRPNPSFCTGTLIGPRVVATASHCTEGLRANRIGFGLGQEPTRPRATFNVSRIIEHPSRDAALLILDRDVTQVVPEVEIIAANTRDPAALRGTLVEAGGYGQTFDARRTGRWFAALPLVAIDRTFVVVDGQGQRGICFGDSGGPVVSGRLFDGEPVVLGVESYGDSDCLGRDHLTRLDAIQPWIAESVADVPGGVRAPGPPPEPEFVAPPADPCGGLTYAGTCEGDTARWCAEGQIRSRDCANQGQTCGFAGEDLGFYCVDRAPEPEPEPEPRCPGLGYEGICEGRVAIWCDGATERQVDCAQYNARCGWAGPSYGYYCVR